MHHMTVKFDEFKAQIIRDLLDVCVNEPTDSTIDTRQLSVELPWDIQKVEKVVNTYVKELQANG